MTFAWGPAGGGAIRRAAALEIVLSAGTGGKGFLEIGDPVLAESPAPRAFPEPRVERTPDGIALDLGGTRELSGLVVDWRQSAVPARFTVEISLDSRAWTEVRRVDHGGARRAFLHLPETEARFVRIALPPGDFDVPAIDVKPVEWAPTANDFVAAIAKEAPRGRYPRAFMGEQAYWTVAGVDADTEEVLVGEDGALEPGKGSFSLEPFLFADGRLVTFRDAAISHGLERRDLPIPTVTWKAGDLALDVTALVDGAAGSSVLRARYRVRNAGAAAARVRLFVAVRPFLVNPPTQFLNAPHGVSRIDSLSFRGGTLTVNRARVVSAFPAPSAFGAAAFDAGDVTGFLSQGEVPPAGQVEDAIGLAFGAFAWDLEIPPGGSRDATLTVPLHGGQSAAPAFGFDDRLAAAASAWARKVDGVRFHVPPTARVLIDTLKSNLAYVLINRDGPWIQPGSRAYERSWIRDGALTSSALLRLGHSAEVRDFLVAFAEKQFADGRIPCCVDARGADPVPEHDSHGEFLFLAAEYFRFTRDAVTLRSLWPRIARTVAAIDALRRQRRTPEYETSEKRAFYGLLPESISHEGYSDKPVHSYWDDAFARKGLADAVELALSLGHPDDARSFAAIEGEFEADLLASIARTIEQNHLDYIPASVERHDFDPTSTTAALSPCGLQGKLPQAELARTFDRYVAEARERRDGTTGAKERRLHAVRAANGRRAREARPEGRGARDARVLHEGPPARRLESVGRGRRPRSARPPLPRGHAAHLGRDRLHPLVPRLLRDRARGRRRERRIAPARGRTPGGMGAGAGRRRGGGPSDDLRAARPLRLGVGRRGSRADRRREGSPRRPRPRMAAWRRPRAATVNGKPAGIRGGEILVREVPAEVVALP